MLNKNKIRIMTKMAIYEQGEGKEYLSISKYFRRDYVGLQMIKSFIASTLGFGILFLLVIFYDLETWLDNLYQVDLRAYIGQIILKFIAFTLFYQVIAWIVYSIRYKKGQRKLKQYTNRLKKIRKLYEQEGKKLEG